jgi:hypothetical protein
MLKRSIIILFGFAAIAFGTWLRLAATDLAWPLSFGYSGPREDTVWAIRERAYQDLGLMLLGFGLLAVLMALGHWLWSASAPTDRTS